MANMSSLLPLYVNDIRFNILTWFGARLVNSVLRAFVFLWYEMSSTSTVTGSSAVFCTADAGLHVLKLPISSV